MRGLGRGSLRGPKRGKEDTGFLQISMGTPNKNQQLWRKLLLENGPRSPRIQVASCLVFMCLVLFIFSWLQTTVKWKWVQQLLFGQYEGDADVEKAVGRLVYISKTARDGVYFTLVAFFCMCVGSVHVWLAAKKRQMGVGQN